LLLGGLSSRYEGDARLAYGIGAMLASFVWFFSLGYGARLLLPLFQKPSAWRVLDILIGIVMSLIAISLAAQFLRS
jgi:L-lysine exporter family protein LysE/ArgO